MTIHFRTKYTPKATLKLQSTLFPFAFPDTKKLYFIAALCKRSQKTNPIVGLLKHGARIGMAGFVRLSVTNVERLTLKAFARSQRETARVEQWKNRIGFIIHVWTQKPTGGWRHHTVARSLAPCFADLLFCFSLFLNFFFVSMPLRLPKQQHTPINRLTTNIEKITFLRPNQFLPPQVRDKTPNESHTGRWRFCCWRVWTMQSRTSRQ